MPAEFEATGQADAASLNGVASSSHALNMPPAVLPSVRTTSLTTSALILLERINGAAMATVSFMRTVATRAVFLRRISPTCMATSLGVTYWFNSGIHNTNCQHAWSWKSVVGIKINRQYY